jgi:hypothetical protein
MRVCFSKHNRRATRSIYAFICLIKLWPKRDLANKKLLIRDSNMLKYMYAGSAWVLNSVQ